jgi:hypothetical protein
MKDRTEYMSKNKNSNIRFIEAEVNESGVFSISVDTFAQPVIITPKQA